MPIVIIHPNNADCVNALILQALLVGCCKFIVTGGGCDIEAFSRSQSVGGTFKSAHEKTVKHQSDG
ncbi:hypothetical protein [Microcoleus vaginatus]|uniref:hypothetical protein n=1 Tax=Microcoleus vaginatus TaxID=119532 RepID=UPI0032A5FC32